MLSAAWRLHIVRTEKYPMDLAIRKQWVAFEKFRVKPNDTVLKSKWENTNWKQYTDHSFKNFGYEVSGEVDQSNILKMRCWNMFVRQ